MKMGFEFFLDKYPIADWIWELFKGIAPTLVAIYAIKANDNRAKKRERESTKDRKIMEYIDYIIKLLEELLTIVRENQKLAYDVIFAIDDNKKDELEKRKNDFSKNRFRMMDQMFLLVDYELSVGKALEISFNAELIRETIGNYQDKLLTIRENHMAPIHDEAEQKEIVQELNEALRQTRSDIFSCIKILAESQGRVYGK